MALKKCPKCELNYIRGDAQFCDVCLRELRREAARAQKSAEDAPEEEAVCSECGEAPALPGSELCADCLREQKRQKELENAIDLDEDFDENQIEAEED